MPGKRSTEGDIMIGLGLHSSRTDLANTTLEVVFVDDDAGTLAGLRRALHRDRKRWSISYCTEASEALKVVKKRHVDVIVSGMQMTDGKGHDLLEAVRDMSPSTARIVLSAESDADAIMHASRIAHQFVTKPCEFDDIRSTIERLAFSREDLPEERLRSIVNNVRVLPTPSDVQRKLSEVMARDHQLTDIAEVVETDVALVAELLRLVNSSFFGLSSRVDTVREAVGLLGMELVEALVATRSAYAGTLDVPVDVSKINRHSQDVAAVAGLAASRGGASKLDRSVAVSAGLLHDVGVLILAQVAPKGAGNAAEVLDVGDLDAERLAFGADRYAIGAHLLDLWAFSPRTTHAVRELAAPLGELGAGTVGWSVRLAHHAVSHHDIGLPAGDDDHEWFDALGAVERELLLGTACDS